MIFVYFLSPYYFWFMTLPNMGVSKNEGTPPKWMVKILLEHPIKIMDGLGGVPPIFGNNH